MELSIPERILFETDVFEVDDDLRVKSGKVRITESRVIFNGHEEAKIIHISDVRMMRIKREEKWGHATAGIIFLISSAILYLLGFVYGVADFTSAVLYFVVPTALLLSALILIYWWWITRSWLLTISMDFGKDVRVRSKDKEELLEIANAIELVKMGAVRRLQQRERSFV